MNDTSDEAITLYTSKWCMHSRSVEKLLDNNGITVKKINIDGDHEARQDLIELNDGFASVPTLVFADGAKLTEPSQPELRRKLDLEPPPSLMERIRGLLGQDSGRN